MPFSRTNDTTINSYRFQMVGLCFVTTIIIIITSWWYYSHLWWMLLYYLMLLSLQYNREGLLIYFIYKWIRYSTQFNISSTFIFIIENRFFWTKIRKITIFDSLSFHWEQIVSFILHTFQHGLQLFTTKTCHTHSTFPHNCLQSINFCCRIIPENGNLNTRVFINYLCVFSINEHQLNTLNMLSDDDHEMCIYHVIVLSLEQNWSKHPLPPPC